MSYTQNEEEKHILNYFNGKVGTFLDIGANDGVTFSNTCALTRLSWRGCFVEPSPTAFTKLKENYSLENRFDRGGNRVMGDLYFYNFALGNTNGIVKFQDSGTHLGNGDHGLLSTMNQKDFEKWNKSTKFDEIEVQCFRWKTFLNRISIKTFDFISSDCEGNDYDVMKQIDLRETQTKLICVEHNGDANLKAKFDELFLGFNVIYTSSENLLYAR